LQHFMILKLPAPVIIFLKLVFLDHGAHRPIEDEDFLLDNIFYVLLHFSTYLPPCPPKGGLFC
jgi:hypothetical protein